MFSLDTETDYATILLTYHAQIEITQTIHHSASTALPYTQDPGALRKALRSTQVLLRAALEEIRRLVHVLEERFLEELSTPGKIETNLKESNLVDVDINKLGHAVAQLSIKAAELWAMQPVLSERKYADLNE